MARTKVYTSLADLQQVYTPNFRNLTLRPAKRTYLSEADAVYDFTVGHDFVVVDASSPFHGCTVSCLDKRTLQQHGYTHAIIVYNPSAELNVEIKL